MTDISPYIRVLIVVNQNNMRHPTSMARVNSITTGEQTSMAHHRHLIGVAAAAGHPHPGIAATRTAATVPIPADLADLIRALTDDDTCETDRTGGCITHSIPAVYLNGRPCPHTTARNLIAAWDAIDSVERDAP